MEVIRNLVLTVMVLALIVDGINLMLHYGFKKTTMLRFLKVQYLVNIAFFLTNAIMIFWCAIYGKDVACVIYIVLVLGLIGCIIANKKLIDIELREQRLRKFNEK